MTPKNEAVPGSEDEKVEAAFREVERNAKGLLPKPIVRLIRAASPSTRHHDYAWFRAGWIAQSLLTASQQPEDEPKTSSRPHIWKEPSASELAELGEGLVSPNPPLQPERPQIEGENEREWTLVGNTASSWQTVAAGPSVQRGEQIPVVPKSSLLAERQRADEAERERDEAENERKNQRAYKELAEHRAEKAEHDAELLRAECEGLREALRILTESWDREFPDSKHSAVEGARRALNEKPEG